VTDPASDALAGFQRWARNLALPLWSSNGFDVGTGLFQEGLTFDLEPVGDSPRRLMVQARQVAVFALASRRGWDAEGRDLALAAGNRMIDAYHEADGEPGWVFSLDPAGRPADRRRDLYAHGFVLFALAWLIRLQPDDRYRMAVETTLAFLDERMADPRDGGYWDALPRPDRLRRQNPHMHLLEALLELFDVLGEARFLDRAIALRRLALNRFIDPTNALLREVFDVHWCVPPGTGRVEPGHLFEWAWLLRRLEERTGEPPASTSAALLDAGLRLGVERDTGRIVDELGPDGMVLRSTSRLWPHCEALKILALEQRRGADHRVLSEAVLRRLSRHYCNPAFQGGWVDQRDTQDRPASTIIPASSLYHLMFALAELTQPA
jgi:mannose-6-phosphate isomerase